MAAACIRLLTDHSLRQGIGRAAKDRALSVFSLERSLGTFRDLYARATSQDCVAHDVAKDQGPSRGIRGGPVMAPGPRVTSYQVPTVPGAHAGVRYPAPGHGSRGGLVPGMSRRIEYSQMITASSAGAGSPGRIAGARS